MSDIDFDELDRAVNGALGGNNTSAPKPPFNEVPAVQEVPTITRIERTTLSPISSDLPPTVTSTPASIAPAARRSSGRFMDMVHPSSDMRSQQTPRLPVENRPESAPVVNLEPAIAKIDDSSAWNEPLESPFLPDAKVEKRPLGGGEAAAAAVEANVIVDSFDFQGLLDEPEEELLEVPQPQGRIEEVASPDHIDIVAAAAITDEIESKAFEAEEPVEVTPVVPEVVPVQPQPVIEEQIGPSSITPQYKEQASSNQESGAMYDTESYHQAVAAPVQKKSGWFTVLWILLLVLLGAGGGWAVFTYVLPML